MTTPVEKPSFLARLAIVATFGAILSQIAALVMVAVDPRVVNTGVPPLAEKAALEEAIIQVLIAPLFYYFGAAGIYYLFKGWPTDVDSCIANRLYRTWGISLVVGTCASAWLFRLM